VVRRHFPCRSRRDSPNLPMAEIKQGSQSAPAGIPADAQPKQAHAHGIRQRPFGHLAL
jgi:hypothetical protein